MSRYDVIWRREFRKEQEMEFRPDTSFPFFALSRKFNMPYSYVLEIAEDKLFRTTSIIAFREIRDAARAEKMRREKIE